MPFISIILATRNRPALFTDALHSVLGQSLDDIEIVVVNDGSDERHSLAYKSILQNAKTHIGDRLHSHLLVYRPNGHGQSYSLNYGVDQACGEYVTFLDDDDYWTDMGQLARVMRVINTEECTTPIDLVFTNQLAYADSKRQPGPIWLEGLASELLADGHSPAPNGSFRVDVRDLMATQGFCHLNTLTVRRALFQKIGGMDETLRWECDRDLYLRLIDNAGEIRYLPDTVSRHNVPAPKKQASMTTKLSVIERRLYQVRVLDKAVLFSKHIEIRRHALRHKVYALKKITEVLAANNQPMLALSYAQEALGIQPTFKWAAYTLILALRKLLNIPGNRFSK